MRPTEKSLYDHPTSDPLLVVLSGPSGVGKDSVLRELKELGRNWHFAVTATTRIPRDGETDGLDYVFLNRDNFLKKVQNGQFLEFAEVYGNWYGVPRDQVSEALGKGQDVIVKVDVRGAATIKETVPEAIFVFLMPPSPEELERRLRERKTETTTDLNVRIQTAREELYQLPNFDYVVVNHQLEAAVHQIESIMTAEKCRITSRSIRL